MNKSIKKLEDELKTMLETHKSLWYQFGSELCTEDMLRREEELRERIAKLKEDLNKK